MFNKKIGIFFVKIFLKKYNSILKKKLFIALIK